MATKAELQAALNQARDEIKVLKCQLEMQKTAVVAPKSIRVPTSPSRREVMAAAKAQAIATGRCVRAA